MLERSDKKNVLRVLFDFVLKHLNWVYASIGCVYTYLIKSQFEVFFSYGACAGSFGHGVI